MIDRFRSWLGHIVALSSSYQFAAGMAVVFAVWAGDSLLHGQWADGLALAFIAVANAAHSGLQFNGQRRRVQYAAALDDVDAKLEAEYRKLTDDAQP